MSRRFLTFTTPSGASSYPLSSTAEAHSLTFTAARNAAQLRADGYAGQRTHVMTMLRQSAHAYYVQAEWTSIDPVGCKGCGFDPATGALYDTPLSSYHAIALRSVCVGLHSRFNLRRLCPSRAYVTDVFG